MRNGESDFESRGFTDGYDADYISVQRVATSREEIMAVLHPIFAMLALTLAVMLRMGLARYRAVTRREVDHHY
ncbi:MAG: hypothetical protein GY888_20220, partial [Planctomycetaceae bacterium]|nr:hypothetical protein [Planctomycetaceae bacterium]